MGEPWTQKKVQTASKPGRTFRLTRRTSFFHRWFLDNSVKKKPTHISEESVESAQDTSLPTLFLFNQFPISNKKKLPKGGKVVFKSSMKRHVQHFSFPLSASPASLALWLTQRSWSKKSCSATFTQMLKASASPPLIFGLLYCVQLHHQHHKDYWHLKGRKKWWGLQGYFNYWMRNDKIVPCYFLNNKTFAPQYN